MNTIIIFILIYYIKKSNIGGFIISIEFETEARKKFKQYDAFQVEVREKLDILTNTVNEHSRILNDIHRVVLLMENQLNDKVSILFDSSSLNNDVHHILNN